MLRSGLREIPRWISTARRARRALPVNPASISPDGFASVRRAALARARRGLLAEASEAAVGDVIDGAVAMVARHVGHVLLLRVPVDRLVGHAMAVDVEAK